MMVSLIELVGYVLSVFIEHSSAKILHVIELETFSSILNMFSVFLLLINLLFLCIVSEFSVSLKLSVVFPLTYLLALIACGLKRGRERKKDRNI